MSPVATAGASHWDAEAAEGSLQKPTTVLFQEPNKPMVSLDLQQTHPQYHQEAGRCHAQVLQVESRGKEQPAPTWRQTCGAEENKPSPPHIPGLRPETLALPSEVAALPKSTRINHGDSIRRSCILHINAVFQASVSTFEVYFSRATTVGSYHHKLS